MAEWIPEYHGYAPFPNQDFQSPEAGGFDTVFSVRIDSLNRLWVLDYGNDGKGKVRLFAFDLETNQLVHTFDFRKEIAPTGSLFNGLESRTSPSFPPFFLFHFSSHDFLSFTSLSESLGLCHRLFFIVLSSSFRFSFFPFPIFNGKKPNTSSPFLIDFQISPDAKFIYIADTSIQGNHPALVLYDIENGVARRVLENFPAVRAVADRPLVIGDEVVFPHLTGKIHVDSIGLDKQGVWLYFAALLKEELYRVRVSELWRQDLAPRELSEKVEMYSKKPVADGITLDTEDNIYLTDIENSAITVITKEKKVVTLVQDEKRLRWPDGVGFDAEGYLYIACSDLHKVSDLGEAPFQIFKIKPGLVEGAQVAGQ